MSPVMKLFYVQLGLFGLLGIFARYFFNSVVTGIFGVGFPIATIIVNIFGSFLIGTVYVLGTERMIISENLRIVLMAGLLGGFTTFSAFSLDTVVMLGKGEYLHALMYIFGSVFGSILATAVGLYVSRLFWL